MIHPPRDGSDRLDGGGIQPLSALLREAADRLPRRPVSLGEMMELLHQRATGTILVLFSIPAILPTPGIPAGMIFGSCLVVVALRLLVGAGPVRLPRGLARMEANRQLAEWVLRRGSGLVARLERVTRPRRLSTFAGPGIQPIVSLAVLLMGVVIALPIPFGNHLPGLAVMAIGAGLASRDGLAVLVGLALTVLSAAVTAGLVWLGYDALAWLLGSG